METGGIAVITVMGLSHEMTNVKMGGFDHRREQQSSGKKGGARHSKLCVMHCIRPVMAKKKHFH